MKKLFTVAIALFTVFALVAPAHAVVYTRSSTERSTDDLGSDVKRVRGTIAFDSDYPCNIDTGRCGEDLLPTQLGMATITHMFIQSEHSTVAGSTLLFEYDSAFTTGSGGTGGIRANYSDTGIGGTSLPSVPTYDLSGLTAVPFLAIGT